MRKSFQNQSWITFVEYDTDTKIMTIHTSKRAYECAGVPEEVYDAFDRSSSRGAFFNENIKHKYMDKMFK